MDEDKGKKAAISILLLLSALFLSGLAAIINQTVWQRALKVYLAGCESVSAMIVVMAFMLGLGLGSLYMGLRAHRIRNPMRALGLVEIGLVGVNLLIALVLSLEISGSVYSFQKFALSLGIPLRLVYGATAVLVLFIPCFLMGLTMPLVSEASQRQLGFKSSGFITILFVLNTLGSVLGGLAAGFYLMPRFGQMTSLFVAVTCNLAAGVVILFLWGSRFRIASEGESESLKLGGGRIRTEEVMGFWLGFLSLGYEMYLFRAVALAHEPLPYNFSLVLCAFLFFWSAGVFLAKRIRECIPLMLAVSAFTVAAIPLFHILDRECLRPIIGREVVWYSILIYSLPCVPFGVLFGQIVARFAKRWGNDVGRYYGLNTLGSCLGILAVTLIGMEINHAYTALVIGLGYAALLPYFGMRAKPEASSKPVRITIGIMVSGFALAFIASFIWNVVLDVKPGVFENGRRAYYGKDGVVEITKEGDLIWDGLWHSALVDNNSHIGTKNWLLSTIPFLCHDAGNGFETCVIGLGAGITAATLAKSDRVKTVDVYDINAELDKILRDYPEGTLKVRDNAKINIMWHDGRCGLALSEKKYDIITQQPLWLKQAGSTILLSEEYMRLVSKRLKKGGVFCIYSNAKGIEDQALLVRRTAAEVFPFCESFVYGYMVIASNEPFSFNISVLEREDETDPLILEIRSLGMEKMHTFLDDPRLEWKDCPYLVTDNHPLLEYPVILQKLMWKYRRR
ncbi:MAG: spermine/spermidine synthase domain-containing protein [Planctomycetota bacterium]